MPVHRVYYPTKAEADQTEQMPKVIEESRQVLKRSSPDTFLGRKTQEPPPRDDGD